MHDGRLLVLLQQRVLPDPMLGVQLPQRLLPMLYEDQAQLRLR